MDTSSNTCFRHALAYDKKHKRDGLLGVDLAHFAFADVELIAACAPGIAALKVGFEA